MALEKVKTKCNGSVLWDAVPHPHKIPGYVTVM